LDWLPIQAVGYFPDSCEIPLLAFQPVSPQSCADREARAYEIPFLRRPRRFQGQSWGSSKAPTWKIQG
jgi:hypothetical protein